MGKYDIYSNGVLPVKMSQSEDIRKTPADKNALTWYP